MHDERINVSIRISRAVCIVFKSHFVQIIVNYFSMAAATNTHKRNIKRKQKNERARTKCKKCKSKKRKIQTLA